MNAPRERPFAGRSVLVTGHTGFKGGWLSALLVELGATVTGLALPPEGARSFFTSVGLEGRVRSHLGDVRDRAGVERVVREAEPEVVFHLAAQPLVLRGYEEPAATFDTNVMGVVRVLDAVRACPSVRAVIVVTSDKCYENDESARPFVEGDRLGGSDPYSASKACAEIVASAYRASFLAGGRPRARLATARAGNVIGGGDHADLRIVPDVMRALFEGRELVVRSPDAVRPWQFVADTVHGYVALARALLSDEGDRFEGAWNFGPGAESLVSVRDLVARLRARSGLAQVRWDPSPSRPAEAHHLVLDAEKARRQLGVAPSVTLDEAIDRTVAWYLAERGATPDAMFARTLDDLRRAERPA